MGEIPSLKRQVFPRKFRVFFRGKWDATKKKGRAKISEIDFPPPKKKIVVWIRACSRRYRGSPSTQTFHQSSNTVTNLYIPLNSNCYHAPIIARFLVYVLDVKCYNYGRLHSFNILMMCLRFSFPRATEQRTFPTFLLPNSGYKPRKTV